MCEQSPAPFPSQPDITGLCTTIPILVPTAVAKMAPILSPMV